MMKKRKRIENIIEIPEGFNVEMNEKEIIIGKGGEKIKRQLNYPIKKEDNKIIIFCEKPTKKDKKLMNTLTSHIKNILEGLEKKFVYKLQICSVHFPMNVSVSNKEVIIKNFLGEKKERRARILDNTEVKIDGSVITIESSDKEKAGQVAANIEMATKIRSRDRRVFQDGIFLIEKAKGRRRNDK